MAKLNFQLPLLWSYDPSEIIHNLVSRDIVMKF